MRLTHLDRRPVSQRRPVLVLPLIWVLAVVLGGCASARGEELVRVTVGAEATTSAGARTGTTATAGVRFVAVGDSITSWSPPAPDAGTPSSGSWVPAASAAPVQFGGGWAVPGARTADMLAHVTPYDADVLVLLGGTNDLAHGMPWAESSANLRAIVATAGVPDVVLSAIPPCDLRPEAVLAYNTQLVALAQAEGWTFVDPWTTVSQAGSYRPGTSVDGTHPTLATADQVGRELRRVVLDGAGD